MSNDVDDLLGDDKPAAKKAAKPAKKAEAKPAAKPAKKAEAKAEKAPTKKTAKPEAKPAAKPAKKAEAKLAKKAKKAEAADPSESNSAVIQALLKVKKATTYADFAEKNDFNIRSVRRAARQLRDAGQLELERDGQIVTIRPAV